VLDNLMNDGHKYTKMASPHQQEEEDEEMHGLIVPNIDDLPVSPPSSTDSNFVTYFTPNFINPVQGMLNMFIATLMDSQHESNPELAEWYTELADLYERKLWHQLILKLDQFISLHVFQAGNALIDKQLHYGI
ncbi:hypothetical protein IFM89_035733, partial [Coptis chinensis]